MTTRSGHTVLGLMLIVGGYALLLASLMLERQRSHERVEYENDEGDVASTHVATKRSGVSRAAPCASGECAPVSYAASHEQLPGSPGRGLERDGLASRGLGANAEASEPRISDGGFVLAEAGGSARVPASDAGTSVDADAGDAPWRAGSSAQFAFIPGGAAMNKAELERLQSVAKVLAQHPDSRITVEGFPDGPGNDPRKAGVPAHRARVGQAILLQAGVAQARITMTTPGLDQAGKLARAMRMIIEPPVPELETP